MFCYVCILELVSKDVIKRSWISVVVCKSGHGRINILSWSVFMTQGIHVCVGVVIGIMSVTLEESKVTESSKNIK